MSNLSAHAARLRSVLAIEDVVGQYVNLKRFGNHYKGLCPFHQEKTPSFTVSPERGAFHCFGCQTGGDIISFIRKAENLEFVEALELLSERAGIPMPELDRNWGGSGDRDLHKAALAAASWAANEYRLRLAEALKNPRDPATIYLQKRDLDATLCSRFGLGLAPDSWDWLKQRAESAQIPVDHLVAAGILGRSADPPHRVYDRFRGRIIFPITDLQGRVVALAGRIYLPDAPETEAKYINSPESEIYKKGETLYALAQARTEVTRQGRALLMEGYLDVMRAHQHGFVQAVATCGTALTDRQAKTLKRFAREVLFAYDGDAAGQTAMLRSTALLLAEGLEVRVIALPAEDDPDTFLRREGQAPFQARLDQAPTWLEHFLRTGLAQNGNSIEGRTRTADQILPLIARIPHPITREACMQRVASALQVSFNAVGESVDKQRARQKDRPSESRQDIQPPPVHPPTSAQPPGPVRRVDLGLIRLLVESVRARRAILSILLREELHKSLVVGPLVELIGQTPDNSNPDYHQLSESFAEGHPLRSAISAMATDPEPLDDSDRTIEVVLARLRREKSLARLRSLSNQEVFFSQGSEDAPAEEPTEEVSAGDWDQLPGNQPPALAQDDLFDRLADAHQVATEAVEQSRVLFQGPSGPAGGRGRR